MLTDQLHLLFLLTPTHRLREPDWELFASAFARFSPSRRKVAERVGAEERFVCLKAEGRPMNKGAKYLEHLSAAKRLWSALLLQVRARRARRWCALACGRGGASSSLQRVGCGGVVLLLGWAFFLCV